MAATITLKRDPLDLSPADKAMILEVMRAMLASNHFSKSKRYPALLEYCIQNTLKGDTDALKERVIGSDVFGRPANYDAGEDPIVRITAGEVRKRIALYFDEHRDAPVRIDLPLGSYVCSFHFNHKTTAPVEFAKSVAPASYPHAAEPSRELGSGTHPLIARIWQLLHSPFALGCAIAVFTTLLLASLHYVQIKRQRSFWAPALHRGVPSLIVVGQPMSSPPTDSSVSPTLRTEGRSTKNQLQMANAIVAAQVCAVLQQFDHSCNIVSARTATLKDLSHKSIVLIGGFDNPWTERLLTPLRYHLQRQVTADYPTGRVLSIIDGRGNQSGSTWSVDQASALDRMNRDYFIVARFHNDQLDADVLVLAGIWSLGTQSAETYLSSSENFRRIVARAPRDWKGFDFEAVLENDVVGGESGTARMLASEFW